MDTTDPALDSIIVNGWPSCTDCLAWSSDGELAVAIGEFVYILTPKQKSEATTKSHLGTIGLRQWHSAYLRTNVFTQSEWPEQYPAPSHSFSIGEEQSLSTVAGLAWSPPGIGPHRRSVLAVLTSNHVLSIWESNGIIGEWNRVFVVNQALGGDFGWGDEVGKDLQREKRRIRAFAWSPPYQLPTAADGTCLTPKWGAVYLAVADDDEVVTILTVSTGKRRHNRTEWNMEVVCHVNLPDMPTDARAPEIGSLFQKAMTGKSPVSKLKWFDLEKSLDSTLEVTQRYRKSFIRVQVSLDSVSEGGLNHSEHSLRLTAIYQDEMSLDSGYPDHQKDRTSENPELNRKVEEARLDFDTHHSLAGNSRIREWGRDGSGIQDVACVTTHPSDMAEYTTASMEKCTLIFSPSTNILECHRKTVTSNPADALFQTTSWTLTAGSDMPLISTIDRRLLGVAASYAASCDDELLRQKAQTAFSRLRETSISVLDQDPMDVDEPEVVDALSSIDIETCLICEALIPFDESHISEARCETGHAYSKFSNHCFCSNC